MKKFFGMLFLCATIFSMTACVTVPEYPGWQGNISWQYTDTAMGTIIQQILYAENDEEAQSFSHQVMTECKALEDNLISWRKGTSELAGLNDLAGTNNVTVISAELNDILARCLDVSRRSEGAFDITIGNVTRLWNIDSWAAGEEQGDFQLPQQDILQERLQSAGYEKIPLQPEQQLVLPAGMQLDLGAVGKGIALEKLHGLLKAQTNIQAAVISAGGSILTYGEKPDGTTWKVGIVDPRNTSQNIAILSLKGDWYVATSGDYERYVEIDGKRYHHILDPATGYPANNGVRSVTILSRDGLLSDALSTACFVLGSEKGMELAGQYEAEVLFVLESGEIVMSENMPVVK